MNIGNGRPPAAKSQASRQPTIKDVANEAGVSFKTVSRVLNGSELVAPAMRQRVEEAIRKLDFRPSLAARQLAGSKSYILGLIAPRAGVSYVARMTVAVATEARALGYHVMTELVDFDRGDWDSVGEARWDAGLTARPDAAIVIPPFPDNPKILGRLEREGIPAVRIAGIEEGYGTTITVDDTEVAIEMVEHLMALGHRRIGLIGPPLPRRASETRVEGYRIALERAGVPFDPALLVRGDFYFASGASAATELLALTDRPTAIFATTDELALGAMAQAQRLGYRIPEDLAIAGFDDSQMSRMTFPPLTTVYQPIREIARTAVRAAIKGVAPELDFQQRLVIRGSTTGDRSLCLEHFEF